MKGRKDNAAAAIEAEEEAGLFGQVSMRPIGSFEYLKRLTTHDELIYVDVYRLDVEGQHAEWPERNQRTTRWFDLDQAALLVEEPGLRAVIDEVRQLSVARYV